MRYHGHTGAQLSAVIGAHKARPCFIFRGERPCIECYIVRRKCNPSSTDALGKLVANINACDTSACDVYVCPSTVHVPLVLDKFTNGASVCPQNCNFTGCGAYTGETSVEQLLSMGISWVLLGHSERRALFGETNELLAKKIAYALGKGMKVVYAIGETKVERESGATRDVLISQLELVKDLLDPKTVVLAYEPVWAIGTGLTATPEMAQETHKAIRDWIAENVSEYCASAIRIQYGGSANAKNASALSAMPDIDGFLVGGASLKPEFVDIVSAISKAKRQQKVALIGSGNWGSAIATKIGINARLCADFEETVYMCAMGCHSVFAPPITPHVAHRRTPDPSLIWQAHASRLFLSACAQVGLRGVCQEGGRQVGAPRSRRVPAERQDVGRHGLRTSHRSHQPAARECHLLARHTPATKHVRRHRTICCCGHPHAWSRRVARRRADIRLFSPPPLMASHHSQLLHICMHMRSCLQHCLPGHQDVCHKRHHDGLCHPAQLPRADRPENGGRVCRGCDWYLADQGHRI